MIDTHKFKIKLEEEKARIEAALNDIGKRDPQSDENWDIKPVDTQEVTFHDEVADRLEEMDERKATEVSLEAELRAINDALESIENNTYGLCKICKKEIESDRLEANPSAQTCKEQLES
jgi:RNA polymerase-binding transcription factor DksA